MKKIVSICIIYMFSISVNSQNKILPGDKSLDMSLIKTGKFTMGIMLYKMAKPQKFAFMKQN